MYFFSLFRNTRILLEKTKLDLATFVGRKVAHTQIFGTDVHNNYIDELATLCGDEPTSAARRLSIWSKRLSPENRPKSNPKTHVCTSLLWGSNHEQNTRDGPGTHMYVGALQVLALNLRRKTF